MLNKNIIILHSIDKYGIDKIKTVDGDIVVMGNFWIHGREKAHIRYASYVYLYEYFGNTNFRNFAYKGDI